LRNIQVQSRDGLCRLPGVLRAAIAVCLVLLILLAAIHVVSAHGVGSDVDHCPLCIVMHSVVPFLVMVVAVLLARIGTATPVLFEVRPVIQYWHPTLFNRPPPFNS
jgi:hypothetical protein